MEKGDIEMESRLSRPSLSMGESAAAAGETSLSASSRAQFSSAINEASRSENESRATALPPVDSGRAAWSFVAAACVLEAMIWGTAFSSGVYQAFHMTPASPIYGSSTGAISAIGTLTVGLAYSAGFVTRGSSTAHPHLVRPIAMGAIAISSLSLIISSFSKSVTVLIIFNGFIYGLSSGIAFAPCLLWIPQWFQARRGLATGIIFASAGIGGIWIPLVLEKLLATVGFAWTLRIWATLTFVTCSAALMFLRPRLPPQRSAAAANWQEQLQKLMPGTAKELAFITQPLYLINALGCFCQAAGWFAISLFLTSYASSLGLSSAASTGVLAAFNGASVVSQILTGTAVDRWRYPFIIAVSAVLAGLCALFLLGFQNLGTMLAFMLTFSSFMGGHSSTWASSASDVARLVKQPTSLIMVSFALVRGLGAVVGPLIAAALYDIGKKDKAGAVWGGHGLDKLIIFVALAMATTGLLAGATVPVRKAAFRGEAEGYQETY